MPMPDLKTDLFRFRPTALAVVALLALLALLIPRDAVAMQYNARVTGTVTDADGKPLEGVKVTIKLMNNRMVDPIPPIELTTNEEGFYLARNVRLGDSWIIFELEGYETITLERELRTGPHSFDVTLVIDAARAMVEAANIANEHYTAGYEAFMASDFAGAIAELEQALAMIDDTPENAEARGSIFALIGRSHYEQRQYDEAVSSYEQWVKYQPNDANAHVELAQVLNETGENDAAMEHFRSALALNPDDPLSLYNIGIVMVNANSEVEGIELIQRAIAAQPIYPIAYKNLGFAYARIERYQEAIGAFEKYLEQAPDAEDAAEIADFIVALKEMIG